MYNKYIVIITAENKEKYILNTIYSCLNAFNNKSKVIVIYTKLSNEKYLKTFNLRSPIIVSLTELKSFINFKGYSDDMELTISSEVYEDLNKEKDSDRFEHIAPNFSFSKTFKTNLSSQRNFPNEELCRFLGRNNFQKKTNIKKDEKKICELHFDHRSINTQRIL